MQSLQRPTGLCGGPRLAMHPAKARRGVRGLVQRFLNRCLPQAAAARFHAPLEPIRSAAGAPQSGQRTCGEAIASPDHDVGGGHDDTPALHRFIGSVERERSGASRRRMRQPAAAIGAASGQRALRPGRHALNFFAKTRKSRQIYRLLRSVRIGRAHSRRAAAARTRGEGCRCIVRAVCCWPLSFAATLSR